MDMTVKVAEVAEALARAARVADKKGTIPILSAVKIDAEDGGESVTLTATDYDISLRLMAPATVRKGGTVCVDARRFAELVKLLSGDVEISSGPKGLRIKSGSYNGTLMTMPADDFPVVPTPEGVALAQVPASSLSSLLARVEFAAAPDTNTYNTAGIRLTFESGRLYAVATDGHRLALAYVTSDGGADPVIIARPAVAEIRALCDGADGDIMFGAGENQLFFVTSRGAIVTRVVDGKFPKWQRLIPSTSAVALTVDRDALAAAIKRVATVLDRSAASAGEISLTVSDGTLAVRGVGANVGEGEEVVAADIETAGEITIPFKAPYIAQFLGAADAGPVRISFRAATETGFFEQTNGAGVSSGYVVAPIVRGA